jgi:hypothetical protein
MTFVTDKSVQPALESFRQFDSDTQLALLWYGYLDIKDQLNPGEGISVTSPATAVYDHIKALPQEQQLQAQRDLLTGQTSTGDSSIVNAYNALASNARIEVWLQLARGMESSEIIQVPQDYQLPESTEQFTNQIKGLDFEQRINFMQSAVLNMGSSNMSNN